MSLRARLTLTYLAIATVAIAGLGIIAYVAARNATYSSVDRTLAADARTIESSFEHLMGPISAQDVDSSRLALDRHAVEGLVFQIWDASGRVLYSSFGQAVPTSAVDAPAPGTRSIAGGGVEMKQIVRPVLRFGETIGTIEVRTPLAQANASVAAIRNVLALGGLLAIGVTGAIAYVVAGHAARPIEALSQLAREVEQTADFTRRLPEQASPSEMKEMAETFNRMITRVEDMVGAQRRFLSDTSHELRRPLTILRTDIDILTEPGLSADDLASVQTEMRLAATSMSSLLTELLILARQDEDVLHREPVDLSAICRSVYQNVATTHPRHSYELHLPNVIWVEGDPQRLERMLTNVIVNAASYDPDSGVIECSLLARGETAVVTVRDAGPGIEPQEMVHIFERFFRGHTGRRLRPEGNGLGLPIVRQIARSHGGDVTIESRPGQGTIVTISLPLLAIGERTLPVLQAV